MALSATLVLIGSSSTFQAALEKQYTVLIERSGRAALEHLEKQPVDAIVLDAVSLNSTGERISRQIKDAHQSLPIVHIHPGPKPQSHSVADVVLCVPLSTRRLLNSVGRMLHESHEEVLELGPFVMNVPRRILLVHGEETQLTPKQALLVELFMRHPGETLDRKMIMEKVWETDYMGDTRTLDVHIRWLRKVMENGSNRPRYLKTIRGVGYALAEPSAEDLQ